MWNTFKSLFHKCDVTEKQNHTPEKTSQVINYKILILIAIGTIIFTIGNHYTPDVYSELDEYEVITSIGFASAALFAFIVSKRYWRSEIFGTSYLALAIGYVFYSIGWNLWWYFVIYDINLNPYLYYPDAFFIAFYPLVIFHIHRNFKYFKRKTSTNQKILLYSIPIVITIIYAFSYPLIDDQGWIQSIEIQTAEPGEVSGSFISQFVVGAGFVFASALTLSYAIVAAQLFRTTLLGPAWSLLLLGISLNV